MQLFIKTFPLILFLLLITKNLRAQQSISTSIHFDTNQHQLSPVAEAKLSETLEAIPLRNIIRIALIGHTDSDGDLASNQKLSERRSLATFQYLIKKGIKKETIETYSKGEVEPKADNKTSEGKAINRRVEVTIVYKAG